MPGFKKIAPPVVVVRQPKLPPTQHIKGPEHATRPISERVIKPVGKAILLVLLATQVLAQTISAPQGGQGACPFPGCRGITSVQDVTEPPFNVSSGTADQSQKIQNAIDNAPGVLWFPAGVYPACQLMLRNTGVVLRGAGKGTTILRCTSGCANLLNTNPPAPMPVQQGPDSAVVIEDMTLDGPCTANLLATNARDVFSLVVNRVGFDVKNAVGIFLAPPNARILNSEFYSTNPGSGGNAITVQRGAEGATIQGNTFKWVNTAIQVGDLATEHNQVLQHVNILDNYFDAGFWAIPTKFSGIDNTNCLSSGNPLACCTGAGTGTCGTGTITYSATTLTDTAANFTGLCNDTGTPPATCSAGLGNFIRVMTPRVTTSASTTGYFRSNLITDASTNFVTANVAPGDLVRSVSKWCTGNGGVVGARSVCTAAAGTRGWGDRCLCTSNSDCLSNVCEKRFATVVAVQTSTTHDVVVDEWTSDTTRRPVGPPYDGPAGAGVAGGNVTIYSWVTCRINNYTSTTAVCDSQTSTNFRGRNGAAVTPAAGTQYEIMTAHPNYPIQGTTNLGFGIIRGNTILRGHSDQMSLFGSDMIIDQNVVGDGFDYGLNIQGTHNIISNNYVFHQGTHGIGVIFSADSRNSDDNLILGNQSLDTPWIGTAGPSAADCPYIIEGRNNVVQGNKAVDTGILSANQSGYCINESGGTTDGNVIDSTCSGTFTTACIKMQSTVANTIIRNYHGETLAPNSTTYSIEGGRTTQALLPTAAGISNGSYLGCSDCTVASPCAGAGNGAFAKRQNAAWVCN